MVPLPFFWMKSHRKEIIFKKGGKQCLSPTPNELHEFLIINTLVPLQLSKLEHVLCLIFHIYYKLALKVKLKFT